MQKLFVLPLALAAGLLLPAVSVFAAPVYTSQGGTTYFGAALGNSVASMPVTPAPTQLSSVSTSSSEPGTTSTASPAQSFSQGSTSYFVPGLGQWVVQPVTVASTTSGMAVTGTSSLTTGGSPSSGAGASSAAAPSTGSSAPVNQTSQAEAFLSLVNQARQQAGLGSLADSPVLDQLALAKAQDMLTYDYVAHYSPRLGWPTDQENAAGFEAQSMGAENIAEAGSIQRAMIDLMSDAGHKANLLYPAFTQTGIAVLPVTGGVLVEELFAGPSL